VNWVDHIFAPASALIWALSVPVINRAFSNLPEKGQPIHILTGLMIAIFFGTGVSFALNFNSLSHGVSFTWTAVTAGLLTFPIATGTYYFSGWAFGDRAELASQFAKVKPAIAIVFAFVILKEPLSQLQIFASISIIIGVCFFFIEGLRKRPHLNAVLLGCLTALFWALGELVIGLDETAVSGLQINFLGLLASAVIFGPALLINPVRRSLSFSHLSFYLPFALHGCLSFGLAYSCFFESIKRIGLGKSILLSCYWPVIPILGYLIWARLNGTMYSINRLTVVGIFFILFGSFLEALTHLV